VRYEYTPGLDKLDQVAVGGQGSYWLNNYMKLGFTADSNEETAQQPWRRRPDFAESANSWLKCRPAAPRVSSPLRCNPMMADSASRALTTSPSPTQKLGPTAPT